MSSRLGMDVRVLRHHDKPFVAGSIPQLDVGFPIAKQYAQIELGWSIQWGFTKFYVDHFPDFLPSLGLRLYPFGKFLSVYGNGSWGTFIFNNSTLTAETGFDLDIKVGESEGRTQYLMIGAGLLTRRVGSLGGFIERDRHDAWYITSKGYLFRFGFRLRVLE